MGTKGTSPIAEFLLPELAHHLTTAQHELDVHLNDRGLCVVCGCAWLCLAL
jgi:hypothetical protein